METLFYLLIALLALSILIFFHELGHYLAARFFGVKIEKFSIGFGKVLFEKECCSTKWAISAIPLGGYVKMKGQDDTNPSLKNSDPDSYNSKKPWQRIIILLAGPFGNIFIAFVLYFLIALFNAPLVTALDYLPPKIGQVSKDSPAKVANLKPQDQILEINGKKIKYWYEIKDLVENSNGDISLKIKRENKILTITLKPKVIEDKNIFNEIIERKIIGIAPYINGIKEIKFNIQSALFFAYRETIKAATLIVKGIKKLITQEVDSKNVAGAITIFDIMIKSAKAGFLYLLYIMALISVNLGILNLLPIPALDGGHIMFNLYEMIFKREPSEEVLYRLTLAGWAILIFLMVFGLYNDINRLFLKG